MGGDLTTLRPAEAKSALAWWLEAGVDALVAEDARDWLAVPAAKAPVETKAPNIKVPPSTLVAPV